MDNFTDYLLPDGGIDTSAIRKKGIDYSPKWPVSHQSGYWYRIKGKTQDHLRDKTVASILGITEDEVSVIASELNLVVKNNR